ncbi:hypothetical protein [Francisella philomiragia]|uniref:hypothetical protein n=1 Tax=Francisella philomiragia TaxID=28110 RepID=UPI0022446AD7|nr:hypothetical protein [Francisella philomiragia]
MFKKKIFKKDIAIYCDTEDKIKSAENYFIANGYEFSELYNFVSSFTKGFKLEFCIQPLPKSKKIYCGARSTFLSTGSKIITFEKVLKKGYQWNEEQGKVVFPVNKVEEKQEEVTYPIFARNKGLLSIARFDSLDGGEIVFDENVQEIGWKHTIGFRPHTDTNVWQILDYDAERSLYDGQPIWCWNNDHKCKRDIRFYDAYSRAGFDVAGGRGGIVFDNYKPLTIEETKVLQPMLIEMRKELKHD